MYSFMLEHSYLLIGGIAMGAIGLLLGFCIGIAAKIFKVDKDPRAELVFELLPGANCGGCGKAGCADFAQAVAAGELHPGNCPVSSRETVNEISRMLGIESSNTFRNVAVVLCGGDKNQTVNPILYNGVSDCRSANMIAGGPKGCPYGCLGLGSCARVCPFGAIEIVNGLAIVHSELCVGCGKCASVCPRKVIKIVNADAAVHIFCSNPEKAPVKRQYCKVPCLGCRKCEKTFPEKFIVENFRGSVNYDAAILPDAGDVEAVKCPTGCLLTSQRHLEIEYDDPDHKKQEIS